MSLAQGNNTPIRPRIEPGSPDPESDALTTRPVRSPFSQVERLPKLNYNGKDIQYAKCVKFLGMYFDHKLTWKAHIDNLIKRCYSDLYLMRMVSGTSFGADKLTLLRIYFA